MTKRIHSNTPESAAAIKKAERDKIELLRRRIPLLDGTDRLLMTMHLENGNSFRQISRLTGVNQASIALIIKKITKRLIDGEYITCLRNRDRFTKQELEVAKDYFLQGEPIKKIAIKRGWTYYKVREMIRQIQQRI